MKSIRIVYAENKSVIPSTRVWLLFSDIETLNLSENEVKTYFLKDIEYEKSNLIYVKNSFEIEKTYACIQKIINSKEPIQCNELFCVYKLN